MQQADVPSAERRHDASRAACLIFFAAAAVRGSAPAEAAYAPRLHCRKEEDADFRVWRTAAELFQAVFARIDIRRHAMARSEPWRGGACCARASHFTQLMPPIFVIFVQKGRRDLYYASAVLIRVLCRLSSLRAERQQTCAQP